MSDRKNTPSTEPYKGVRDFYPEDYFIEESIWNTMRRVAVSYGYEEYSASPLEPTELYTAKTSEEIIKNQTYTFTDRGDREVTLRPEMTPTVARMVAGKRRDLLFPLRWFSIANVFRYERPQRGRLREHYQLNADLLGVEGTHGEVEIISLAADIMHAFGATDKDFVIRINSRKLINALLFDHFALNQKDAFDLIHQIDTRGKVDENDFLEAVEKIIGNKTNELIRFLDAGDLKTCTDELPELFKDMEGVKELENLLKALETSGIHCTTFDPSLVRGFDYYTGIVFEVFDIDPKNSRSLFGGGRFDHLVEQFGVDPVPAVGFGMGDVTLIDFLETRGLLPAFVSKIKAYICTTEEIYIEEARSLAKELRRKNVGVEVDLSFKRIGDQIRIASKKKIPYVLLLGKEEIEKKSVTLKNLESGKEETVSIEKVHQFLV